MHYYMTTGKVHRQNFCEFILIIKKKEVLMLENFLLNDILL